MKMTTISNALTLAFLAISISSCKGLLEPEEKDSNVPVKMVHTYEITSEETVSLIWNISPMSTGSEEVFLNGKSIGKGMNPAGQLASENQIKNIGTQTYVFETTSTYFYSSFQIDWKYSQGKQLSYKLTATRDGKVVFEDEVSFPNKKQPHIDGISSSNGYTTATLTNAENIDKHN